MTQVTPARPEVGGATVPSAFDAVARSYDLMVALSPGYHAQLRSSAEALVSAMTSTGTRDPGRRLRLVDLGCGSGASTAALLHALDEAGVDAEVIGVDGSAGMLAVARRKTGLARVEFRQADAEQLDGGELGEVDGVLAAYLVRNVAARDRLLRQVHGLLRPGGSFVVHDYSVRESRPATLAWSLTCWLVVIPLGLVSAPRSPIYRYLWRSVLDFDGVRGLVRRLHDAGFPEVDHRTHPGVQRGQVHTWRARKEDV